MATVAGGKLVVTYTVTCARCYGQMTVTAAVDKNDAAKQLRSGEGDDYASHWVVRQGHWYHEGCATAPKT